MNEPPASPVRMVSGKPSREALAQLDCHWRLRYLMLAPHRLGFSAAMVVLVWSGAWWALVQTGRVAGALGLPYAVSPSLLHAAVMVFGFMPLFFTGFLFTAAPKWLKVEPWPTARLLAPVLLQVLGWLLWLVGGSVQGAVALTGLACAALGLVWISFLFWRLVLRSSAPDQLHARWVGVACIVGSLALLGTLLALVLQAPVFARALVLTGLWGFVVVVFVTVVHRMVPFFTSNAMPLTQVWRPFWALWLMLATAVLEAVAVWVEFDGRLHGSMATAWMLARGALELGAGAVLVWLAVVWGVQQRLKNRLMAMLNMGFLWLGLSLLLAGASQWRGLSQGTPAMPLAALHALTMGCLASLMLAMVTRVACGHAGRALVADSIAWSLFCLLQLATLLRMAAAWPSAASAGLLWAAALLWTGLMAVWGARLGAWFGRVRVDGRPG